MEMKEIPLSAVTSSVIRADAIADLPCGKHQLGSCLTVRVLTGFRKHMPPEGMRIHDFRAFAGRYGLNREEIDILLAELEQEGKIKFNRQRVWLVAYL